MKISGISRILIPAGAIVLLGIGVAIQMSGNREPDVPRLTSNGDAPSPLQRKTRPSHRATRDSAPGHARSVAAADIPRSLADAPLSDWENPEQSVKHLATLTRWAASEPAACRDWLVLQAPAIQERLIPEIAGSLMAETPLEAFHFLNNLPPSLVVDEMLRQAAMELATRDSTAVVAWADEQTNETARELLLSAAYCVQAQTEPAVAAKAALEHIRDPVQRERSVVEITQRWVQSDPAAAAGFSGTLPGELSPVTASVVASQWVLADAAACSAWILTLPPMVSREAFRPFLDHEIHHDRDSLIRMAPAIKDPELQKMLQQTLDASP